MTAASYRLTRCNSFQERSRADADHASGSKITSPSNHRRRSRRTEWRASDVKWKDDTRPPANIAPAIIFLVYVARDIALQDHRAEIVAEEAAHRELALLLIAQNWLIQIPGTETDPRHLPLAEATARRQIDVDEVWITSKASRGYH